MCFYHLGGPFSNYDRGESGHNYRPNRQRRTTDLSTLAWSQSVCPMLPWVRVMPSKSRLSDGERRGTRTYHSSHAQLDDFKPTTCNSLLQTNRQQTKKVKKLVRTSKPLRLFLLSGRRSNPGFVACLRVDPDKRTGVVRSRSGCWAGPRG